MATEPINIFSHRIDPSGVAKLALKRDPGAKVTGAQITGGQIAGPGDDWETIAFTPIGGGFLKRGKQLVLGHHREYYDGDDWSRQVLGMLGYFSNFPETPAQKDIFRLIRSFRFSISVPVEDLDIESSDPRLEHLFAICEHLDGVFFLPSALRDCRGRILLGAEGSEQSPDAVLPQIPPDEELLDVDDVVFAGEDEDGDEDATDPPTPDRVARRTLAMTAVCARATLEIDNRHQGVEDADMHRERLITWVEELGIGEELEPQEWKVLQRPVGRLEEQDLIDAMWRVEGLVILAWALGLAEPPPYDELVNPPELYQQLGIFDPELSSKILASPTLRDESEIQAMMEHLLAFHWRLRDFSLRPKKMDFVKFSRECWFGSFDISRFNIVRGDLALGGVRIDKADVEALDRASSTATERHQAINWLAGWSEIYSETDTST